MSIILDFMGGATELDQRIIKAIPERWSFIDGEELEKELPPRAWLCEGLALCPGAVSIIGGAGFGGKTISLQSLMLAVASGKPIWGQFPVEQGRVMHLDWEQGRDLTIRRYQRLARGMSVSLAQLQDMIQVSCIPKTTLDEDNPNAERELVHMLRGFKVCVIDAFRGAFPKANENDSGVRKYLDMLGRVSGYTGCTVITIAHSRKMGPETDDARSSLRGSAALFDAAQTVYMLDGTPGKPTRVACTKERLEGNLTETFGLRIVDIDDGTNKKWGLNVEFVNATDLSTHYLRDDAGAEDAKIALNAERMGTLAGRVVASMASRPDGMTSSGLAFLFGIAKSKVDFVVKELVVTGSLREEGTGQDRRYFAIREPGED